MSQSFSLQEFQQLIGEKEVEIRLWRREYARLQARVAELETQMPPPVTTAEEETA